MTTTIGTPTLGDVLTHTLGFDSSQPAFRDNPYPHYARLRSTAPIFRSPHGFWVLSRYAECARVLRDERFGHPEGDVSTPDALLGGSSDQRHFVLFMNPPDHTRVRAALRAAFTPAVVNAMRAGVERRVAALLEAADPRRFDLIGEFGQPLAVGTTCDLLGVPDGDRADLVAHAARFLAGIDPSFALSPERAAARDDAFAHLGRYFADLVALRRRTPGTDLVSTIVSAADRSGQLSSHELEGAAMLLFIAGHGTTTNLIGNGAPALIRDPAARRRYLSDPALAGSGIEELLRFDSPSQLTVRTALTDADLAGHLIRRGQQVVVLRGAANRDPEAFAEPDRLDLSRPGNRHLSFGHGVHRCIGAALARMEGRVAFGALLRRAPGLRLADAPLDYRPSLLIRGLTSLPAVLG